MRKFYLWTPDMDECFDLNTKKLFAADPSGLGNTFEISYQDADSGKYVTNVRPNFDNIKFTIYFNASNDNGYANYKKLMNFLAKCGTNKFILEYNDGITDKYCDVILRATPKTEIDEDGVFSEDFEFERQTYWYELLSDTFSLRNSNMENSRFPLKFPLAFRGKMMHKEYEITNEFFVEAPIQITISGLLINNINIYIKNADTEEIIQEIQLSRGCVDGTTITINPDTKKIIVNEDGEESNGYGLTDKTKDSFLYLPQGTYIIGANIADEDTGRIEFAIRRYLLD